MADPLKSESLKLPVSSLWLFYIDLALDLRSVKTYSIGYSETASKEVAASFTVETWNLTCVLIPSWATQRSQA